MDLKTAIETALYLIDEAPGSEGSFCYLSKLPLYFDMAQKEVAAVCPIVKTAQLDIVSGSAALPPDFEAARSLLKDGAQASFRIFENTLSAESDGRYLLEYTARPASITQSTPDSYIFELPERAQDALPYFAAALCVLPEDVGRYAALMGLYAARMSSLSASPRARVWGGIDV